MSELESVFNHTEPKLRENKLRKKGSPKRTLKGESSCQPEAKMKWKYKHEGDRFFSVLFYVFSLLNTKTIFTRLVLGVSVEVQCSVVKRFQFHNNSIV